MTPRKGSATGLGLLSGCPFRYYQTREADPRVDDAGPEALRGRIFHDAARRYCGLLKEAGQESDPVLAAAALTAAMSRTLCPRSLRADVESLWGRHVERFRLDLAAYVSHEELIEDPDYTWIPDLLYARERGVEVVDFKTYFHALSEAEAREDFQARFYAWRASVLWPGFFEYRFTFDFTRLGRQVSVTFTVNELAAFADEVAELDAGRAEALARIAAGTEIKRAFPPRPGDECPTCRLACPVADDARLAPVRVDDTASVLAGQILALEAALKARKTVLRAYCDENGPLRVNGMEFAIRPRTSVEYPAPAVVAAVLDKRLDAAASYSADEVAELVLDAVPDVGFSKTALEKGKVLRKHPELIAAGKVSTSYEFRAQKAGAVDVVEVA
jgi:hypothetical protein